MNASVGAKTAIRFGTLERDLDRAQTTTIANRIVAAAGVPAEIIPVDVPGDAPVSSRILALREALLAGDCDVIVHSLAELPTDGHPGLAIGAIPKRTEARDVLCARDGLTLATLPEGARVGTDSALRTAQLLAARPDLIAVPSEGDAQHLLSLVADGELDAVVLSAATLGRLGLLDSAATEYFDLSAWPTTPGQGGLAVEVTAGRLERALASALASIHHVTTEGTTLAERLVLSGLGADRSAPLGASAAVDDGLFFLTATVYSPDGTRRVTSSHAATPESNAPADLLEAARDVADRVADELSSSGAAEVAPLGGAV